MKKYLFGVLMIGLTLVACSPKDSKAVVAEDGEEAVKTVADYTPSKALVDSVSYLFGVNMGSMIKGYDFGELNMSQVQKGVKDFLAAKGNFRDPEFGKQFKIDPNELNDLFNKYLDMRRNMKLLANKEAEEKFLAENKEKEGVVALESGLQYKIIEAGNENKPVDDKDTVWVRYKGATLDGNVFDEVKADQDSIQLILNRVVKGWTEGLKYVGEGGKIQLYIPAALGYGERGQANIEPNSTLVFDVELCKLNKYVAPVEEETAKKSKK